MYPVGRAHAGGSDLTIGYTVLGRARRAEAPVDQGQSTARQPAGSGQAAGLRRAAGRPRRERRRMPAGWDEPKRAPCCRAMCRRPGCPHFWSAGGHRYHRLRPGRPSSRKMSTPAVLQRPTFPGFLPLLQGFTELSGEGVRSTLDPATRASTGSDPLPGLPGSARLSRPFRPANVRRIANRHWRGTGRGACWRHFVRQGMARLPSWVRLGAADGGWPLIVGM